MPYPYPKAPYIVYSSVHFPEATTEEGTVRVFQIRDYGTGEVLILAVSYILNIILVVLKSVEYQ